MLQGDNKTPKADQKETTSYQGAWSWSSGIVRAPKTGSFYTIQRIGY